MQYPSKDPEEVVIIRWNCVRRMADDEYITDAVFTVTLKTGNHSDPSEILHGDPEVDGVYASQWISGGEDNHVYVIRAVMTTSSGQVFVGVAELPVNTK